MCHIVNYTIKGGCIDLCDGIQRSSVLRLRYTSLGSTYNTFPNPALLIQPSCVTDLSPETDSEPAPLSPDSQQTSLIAPSDPVPLRFDHRPIDERTPIMTTPTDPSDSGIIARYRPAYELADESLERAGRSCTTKLPLSFPRQRK
jgi:FAD synthetase